MTPKPGDGSNSSDTQNPRAVINPKDPSAAISFPSPIEEVPLNTSEDTTAYSLPDTQPHGGGSSKSVGGTSNGVVANTPDPVITEPLDVVPIGALAEWVENMEGFREAITAQFNQMTKTEPDSDGIMRGKAMAEDHPAVVQAATFVEMVVEAEKEMVKLLENTVRAHPLGPWIMRQRGIGPKAIGRLLGMIGDPAWNSLYKRRRKVSELITYCGFSPGTQRRVKGEQLGHSPDAKMRVWNVVDATNKQLRKPCKKFLREDGSYDRVEHVPGECKCSPYRVVYDEARARYKDSEHNEECPQCSVKGAPPAPIGSPRSPGHLHAMAYRVVGKQLLKDIWAEANRIHARHQGMIP